MATCKELNDEVGGNNDEMSTSIQGSIEDGQECCSTDDSDIDSDATKGIDIVVHYQKKIRKIKYNLTKQIHIPLTWERNLKLQYVYNNQDILQPKLYELRKLADNANINRGIVNVYFCKLEDETVFDGLKKSIENILFDKTGHLALSWFPIPSSLNPSEFREELKAMLPDSELGMQQQLYVDTSDATFVHFVHDENVIDKVSDLFNDVFLKAKANTMSGASTDSIQIPFVYFDMLKKQGMVENVTKAFPDVCLFLDAIESEEILRIKLKGDTEVLQRAKAMIHDSFIKPLTYVRIMFDDIVDFCEQVDIAGIVEEILKDDKATVLCWTLSKYTRNIHLCGKSADEILRLKHSIKSCIERKKVNVYSIRQTVEGLTERLKKMFDERITTASSISTFRLMSTSGGFVLFTTGWKKQNDYLSKVISRTMESKHETNTPDLKSQTKNLESHTTKERTSAMNRNSEIWSRYADSLFEKQSRNSDFPLEKQTRDPDSTVKKQSVHPDYTLEEKQMTPDFMLEKQSKTIEGYTTHEGIRSLHDYRFGPMKSSTIETELGKGVDVQDREDKRRTALTNYQQKYVMGIIEESQEFDHVTRCFLEIWPIVKERTKKWIQVLKNQGCEVSYMYETEFLYISNISSSHKPPEIEIIECYIKNLQEMSIIEVELDRNNKKSDPDIQEWCTLIEQQNGKECCMLCREKYSVFVYCDTYENAQKIKHQIMVKDGQIKVKPRRGQRILKDPRGTGLCLPESSTATEVSDTVLLQNASADHRYDKERDRKGQKKPINPEFTLEKQSKNLQRYTTNEGIKVHVYQANILKLPVDCIVNAANDSLQHGGGVARVIAQAAGRTLDNEGFEYIQKHGKVPVGKACVTTAGKLHYDCVIHAVGPRWSDYRPHSRTDAEQCEKDLYSAIMESFLAAEARGLESIALPPISAAIFAVPTELCVYHYAKATLDYSRKKSPSCLKEIHFIDINPAIISSIQRVFTAFLRDKRDPGYSTDRYVKSEK